MKDDLLNFDLPKKTVENLSGKDYFEKYVNSIRIVGVDEERKMSKRDIDNLLFYIEKLKTHVPILIKVRRGGTRLIWKERENIIVK